MTTTEAKVKNALKSTKEKQVKKPKTNKDYVTAMLPAITKALPDSSKADQFSRAVLTALSTNPQLQQCTPTSFMGAMMMSAQLGLYPNTPTGHAYLIPYRNKGKLECQFQLGYRGLLELANRSGQIQSIQAHTVYENDFFEYEYGLHPDIRHKPATGERGDPIAFYAIVHMINGGYIFEVMSKEDVDAHAKKYSQSFNSKFSPWKNSYEAMAKKTVLKQVLKYAPMQTDFARQVYTDETIKQVTPEAVTNEDVDVIDLPNDFDYEVEPEDEPVEEEPFAPVQESITT